MSVWFVVSPVQRLVLASACALAILSVSQSLADDTASAGTVPDAVAKTKRK